MKVFISSTYSDLKEYRQKAIEVVNRYKCLPLAMEFNMSQPRDAEEVSYKEVEDCDVFVGIYAYRYGYVPKGERKSITQQEYELAKKLNKPRLCFLVSHGVPWNPDFIEFEARKNLTAFLDTVKEEQVISFFENPADFESKFASSLGKLLAEKKEEGKLTWGQPSSHKPILTPATSFRPNLLKWSGVMLFLFLFLIQEEDTLRYRFIARGYKPIEDTTLVVVAINEKTYQKNSSLVGEHRIFSRQYLANLIHRITQDAPVIIALDFVLSLDSKSDSSLIDTFQELPKDCWIILPRDEFNRPLRKFLVKPQNLRIGLGTFLTNDEVVTSVAISKNDQLHFDYITYCLLDSIVEKPPMDYARLVQKEQIEHINFRGAFNKNRAALTLYESDKIINQEKLKNSFKNKIVLIGGLYTQLGPEDYTDLFTTPFSNSLDTPGVIIHANIISNLLNNDFLRWPGNTVNFASSFIIALPAVIMGYFWRRRMVLLSVCFLLYILICISISIILFSVPENPVYLPIIWPARISIFSLFVPNLFSVLKKETAT